MPVRYDEDKKKWCYGDKCIYDTKEDANAAAAAIHINKSVSVKLTKSLNEDKQLFTAVVLRPNVVDSQGDIYDSETVEKACYDFNEFCRVGNLQHIVNTDLLVPVESWIAKSSHPYGDGEIIEGDWVMTMKIKDDTLWQMCKDGEFTGFSVGCSATVVYLEDNNG